MSNDRFNIIESIINENENLIRNATTVEQIKDNVAPKLASEISKRIPFQDDRFIYRAVVVTLGAVVLFSTVIYAYLAFHQVIIPDALVALASAAIGAIAGLLAPSPGQ